jgi:hypothetical protein
MEEKLKDFYNKFNNLFNYIDNELKTNNQFQIDALLINHNPSDVITIISNYAPSGYEYLKNDRNFQDYFIAYLYKKKDKLNNLSMSNSKFGNLLSKDSAGQVQHTKEESYYYYSADPEKYLEEILGRLIDCVNLYYSLYHNKDINVKLGDGTKLTLQFLEENLLHILGITNKQVNENLELRKALNIPDWKRLNSIEILERIIKDIQTNNDIICLQMKKNIQKIARFGTSGEIIKTQIDQNTTSELLPYDKIDLKTRAFMNSGPYNGVSVVSGVADNTYFIRDDKTKNNLERDIQQVRISKTDFDTLEKDNVIIDTVDGQKISISRGDYVFNGYTKRDEDIRTLRSSQIGTTKRVIPNEDGKTRNNIGKFKRMFDGQTPLPIVEVENPDGSSLVFSPEEQQQMFWSLYFDFSGEHGMNFETYFDILQQFTEDFKKELESQALVKTENGIIIPTQGGRKM